jgi:hypothetical protein
VAVAPRPIRARRRVAKAGLILRLALTLVIAALVVLPLTTDARADGDPASDVLYTQWVFLPFESPVSKDVKDRLDQVVQSSRSAGYPIKVAVIGAPADLGTAYALWRQPQQYARFLGSELIFLYKGPLLIVMPNGFGIFHYRHPVVAERSVLAKLRVQPGDDGLVNSAVVAVARLAAASGHPVPVPPPAKDTGSSGSGSKLLDRLIIGAAGAAVVILVVAVPVVHRRRSREARAR